MRMLLVALCAVCLASATDQTPPSVIHTIPANGKQMVKPGPMVMTATFDEPMMSGNYSWAYTSPETFPKINGEPGLKNGDTVATLPVILEPNKEYEVWINSTKFNNFKDKAGKPAAPYKRLFKTGPKE